MNWKSLTRLYKAGEMQAGKGFCFVSFLTTPNCKVLFSKCFPPDKSGLARQRGIMEMLLVRVVSI